MTPRGICSALLALGILLAADVAALADSPLLDDDQTEFDSANGRFVAKAGPKRRSTLVYRRGTAGSKPELLWQMPDWPYRGYLSDDGEHLVICNTWGEHIDVRYDPDQIMMRFFKVGRPVATVRLRDLIRDFGHLRRTVSHYFWGEFQGFISPTLFAVDTVDVRRLVFDVTTGKIVGDEPSTNSRVQPPEQSDAGPPPVPTGQRKSPRQRRRH